MKPGQIIGPGRYNYGRDIPEWKKKKPEPKQEEVNDKITVSELIKELLDSYDSKDIVLKYHITVKTPFSKRILEYPSK